MTEADGDEDAFKFLARLFCPRCQATFTAVGALEAPEGVEAHDTGTTVGDAEDDDLADCPRCGGELQVLELSDDMRETLRENREDDRWRGLP